MKKNRTLGQRMKEYEAVNEFKLVNNMPVIIRLDGRAFHTFTKGFTKPFDFDFNNCMHYTMKRLCENIPNCVFGYTQSDEITLVLVNDFNPNSCAWFDNNLQKIASISASMATWIFNKSFLLAINEYDFQWRCSLTPQSCEIQEEHKQYVERLRASAFKGAMFDARVFTVPKDEIINCLIWRQQDAIRNSIQSCGQAVYSHRELHGKSSKEILEMLAAEPVFKFVNWENQPTKFKYGSCCVKDDVQEVNGAIRTKWRVDYEIPVFTEDREYVNKWLYAKEDTTND